MGNTLKTNQSSSSTINNKKTNTALFISLVLLAIAFLSPIFIVFINSFKGQFFIGKTAFKLPDVKTFVRLTNYTNGIEKIKFFSAFRNSLFITVSSVIVIVLFTSMTAWFIMRVKNKFNNMLYYLFAFSMLVPFQMVMFTMVKFADVLSLDNQYGIVVLYLGFGAGQAVFMFCGFIKAIPIDIEEAAMIDGCNPLQTFFRIVSPILKPTSITIGILNTMWIWNDYLLPLLVLGSEKRTIPIAIQYLRGGYGSIDMGAMMAMLVLAMIPIILFYLICQKYIIEGVVAGAVKG